jgi:hypothetical protein
MAGNTIVCAECGAAANVINAHHVYASKMFGDGGGRFEHVLIESSYDIDCPTCSRRTQVVPAEPKSD